MPDDSKWGERPGSEWHLSHLYQFYPCLSYPSQIIPFSVCCGGANGQPKTANVSANISSNVAGASGPEVVPPQRPNNNHNSKFHLWWLPSQESGYERNNHDFQVSHRYFNLFFQFFNQTRTTCRRQDLVVDPQVISRASQRMVSPLPQTTRLPPPTMGTPLHQVDMIAFLALALKIVPLFERKEKYLLTYSFS